MPPLDAESIIACEICDEPVKLKDTVLSWKLDLVCEDCYDYVMESPLDETPPHRQGSWFKI